MSDSLPGYDAWKTDAPDWESAEEEAEAIRKNQERRDEFAADLKALIHDSRGDLYLSELWGIARDVLMKTERTAGEPAWQTRPTRWPDPDAAEAALHALKDSYTILAFAFQRIHALPRTRDTELAKDIEKVRARIERIVARAALAKAEGGAG